MIAPYPQHRSHRNRWVAELRTAPNAVDAFIPYAFLSEQEPDAGGVLRTISTLFLTNRECPWKCVMCDLWRNTLAETVPAGAIVTQINHALERLTAATQIKLYNSGSFFDPRAIPPADFAEIARRLSGFDRVIVECHPAFIANPCVDFATMLGAQLEIAIGLETAHPRALEQLNKGMTLEQFSTAAQFLCEHRMDVRVFLLVHPPFIEPREAEEWIGRSIDFAFERGASVVSLIPTRAGNGAMEALRQSGQFTPPSLSDLERAADYGVSLHRGRVFADLWDLERFSNCPLCFEARRNRLDAMNRLQIAQPAVHCEACGGSH